MPANIVKPGEERYWKRAKAAAKKQYPTIKEDSDRFYKIVTSIFQNMTGQSKTASAVLMDKIANISIKQVNMNPSRFSVFAAQAAKDYLEKEALLNDSIKKIASDNGLNPEQIKRVCEKANIYVFENMYKGSEDKTFNFPLADATKITAGLQNKPKEIVKKASLDYTEIFDPESLIEKKAEKIEIRKDHTKRLINKIAGEYDIEAPLNKKRTQIALGRLKVAEEELRAQAQKLEWKYTNAHKTIHDSLKQHILHGEEPSYIEPIVKHAINSPIAKKILNEEEIQLKKSNILKKAQSLTGGEIVRKTINFTHPFFEAFRTIEKAAQDLKINIEKQGKIKKMIDMVKTKIKEL